MDGAFATAFSTLLGGAFMVGYIQFLHGSVLWINAIGAIPGLLGVLQVFGPSIAARAQTYKRFVGPGGFLWRALYVPLIFLPLLVWRANAVLAIVAILIFASWALGQIVTPVYNEWLAALVPPNSRGVFFGKKNAVAVSFAAVSAVCGGVVLDAFQRSDHPREGFAVVFGLGVACAAVSFFFFAIMRDLPLPSVPKVNLRASLNSMAVPFRRKSFRPVIAYLAITAVGQTFAGNLFAAFALESLKMSYSLFQITAVMMAVGTVASTKFWAFVADRYGNKPALALSGAMLVLNPIPWMLCPRGNPILDAAILFPSHIFFGVTWAGINLCQFNILLSTTEPDDRGSYIAAGTAVTSLVNGLAPMLGALFVAGVASSQGLDAAFRWVFGVTIGLRVVGLLFLAPVREPGSTAISRALGSLRSVTPRGVKAIRTLSSSTDTASKEAALQQVAEGHVTLAAEEVIKALHDPIPAVRRQAATTLAQLKDPRALGEIIHQFQDHPDLIEEEMVEALGVIGDPKAVPTLISTLKSPRPLLRRTAAHALSRIREVGASGREALIAAAEDTGDPDLRRAALQAIRQLRCAEGASAVVDALLDPTPSVRIAAAEAAVELDFKHAAEALRESLRYYRDEATAEVAYALGAVGEAVDLESILYEARRCASIITRRRCLLGAARLLGVEGLTFRWMMLDGMQLDSALVEHVRKRGPALREALNSFASGDELEALNRLAEGRDAESPLKVLAAVPVEESFLVALAAVSSPRRR